MSNFKFLNKKLFIFLVVAILFSQAGFVLALGEECRPYGSASGCKTGEECCCCPEAGCDADHAGVCGNARCTNVICSFSSYRNLEGLIKSVTDFIFKLGIIIAPLMIVIGGFIFMTSGGAQSRTTMGKNIMKWAIIGLGIILFAWGIKGVIKYIITG